MFLTALEANRVPQVDIVTDRLLHEDMVMQQRTKRKGCGHIQQNCTEPAQVEQIYDSRGQIGKQHVRQGA